MKRNHNALLYVLLVGHLCTACGAGDAPNEEGGAEEEEFASFVVDGKADGWGYEEGDATSIGVLRAANVLTESELKTVLNTKTAAKAIPGILAARQYLYSDIRTLEELDAISWVGVTVFKKLLAHASTKGWIPLTPGEAPSTAEVFDPAACPDSIPAATGADFTARFPAVSTTRYWDGVAIGWYRAVIRERQCTKTGCGTWKTIDDGHFDTNHVGEVMLRVSSPDFPGLRLRRGVWFNTFCDASQLNLGLGGWTDEFRLTKTDASQPSRAQASAYLVSSSRASQQACTFTFFSGSHNVHPTADMRTSCMQGASSYTTPSLSTNPTAWTETQLGVLARY